MAQIRSKHMAQMPEGTLVQGPYKPIYVGTVPSTFESTVILNFTTNSLRFWIFCWHIADIDYPVERVELSFACERVFETYCSHTLQLQCWSLNWFITCKGRPVITKKSREVQGTQPTIANYDWAWNMGTKLIFISPIHIWILGWFFSRNHSDY